MKKEVEILWWLNESPACARRKLKRLTTIGASRTIDEYFADPLRSDLQPDSRGRLLRCFRLRRKPDCCLITYKVDRFRGKTWLCSDEYETATSDGKAIRDIIGKLGLRPLVTINSTKEKFANDDFEVVLERVVGLGNFIEVESRKPVTAKNVEGERRRIRAFVHDLGITVGEELNAGKPELMLTAQKKRGK